MKKRTDDIAVPAHSDASRRARAIVIGLAIALVAAATISLLLGRYPINPMEAAA
ncbi:MAG: iron ABC transporter permease, partial [Adlercreutzia sp.]|nr:iron ABC transporter permease [Adlercreutzia sp.]